MSRGCTPQEITKAYHTLAKHQHPDKQGGDAAKFQRLTAAYEVLRDTNKRQAYDTLGELSLDRRFFSSQKQPIRFKLYVELSELYTGCRKKLSLSKTCGGSGCTFRPCPVEKRDVCVVCVVDVDVQPGMASGDVIHLQEDVVVQLVGVANQTFTRKGNDLFYKKRITLLESVDGVGFKLDCLDGQIIHVQSSPGDLLPHACTRRLTGYGFPVRHNHHLRGDMYVQFLVEWPEAVDASVVARLRELCPVSRLPDSGGDVSVFLSAGNAASFEQPSGCTPQ